VSTVVTPLAIASFHHRGFRVEEVGDAKFRIERMNVIVKTGSVADVVVEIDLTGHDPSIHEVPNFCARRDFDFAPFANRGYPAVLYNEDSVLDFTTGNGENLAGVYGQSTRRVCPSRGRYCAGENESTERNGREGFSCHCMPPSRLRGPSESG
jgi:hypothetical protein